MIETPHAKDPRRNVPIFSLYSETREPTPEMLDLIDVLVIDLQDVGARIYTFIYTMANCLRAAARAGRPRHRLRPAQSDRRRRGRRADAGAGLRILRRAVSHSDAPRHDHRRAGAAVQRALRHRRRARDRADGGLVARHVLRRHRPPLGDALAQHADARHGHRLSGHGAVRRHDAVGRPRHDASVRVDRRAVARRRSARRAHEPCSACPACTSARRRSSRPSRSTRGRPAAAARST